MGCFVSCFRNQEGRTQRCNKDSYHDQGTLNEQFVVKELGSPSLNGENEEKLDHPHTSDKQLTQAIGLEAPTSGSFCETNHIKQSSAIQETLMEICQSNKRIALQELNGSNNSSESAHTLSDKKTQLVVQREQEKNPDQATVSTPSLEMENCTSIQNTPGSESSEETKDCKMDLTQIKNVSEFPVSDPNSPYLNVISLNGEMQTPAAADALYKGIPMTDKQVYAALKLTHQGEVSSDFKSVELKKENEVAQECSFHNKKRSEDTPKVVVPDLSQYLNGIPNTTTKYNEDQRVKWHATPFEERLERILSDEKMPPLRKLISGRLIELEE